MLINTVVQSQHQLIKGLAGFLFSLKFSLL